MLWWLATRALVFGLVATFDLNRVSPVATAAVRSAVAMGFATIQRIRLLIKGDFDDQVEVPNTLIAVEHDNGFQVMMDVFGYLSLYQAACATIVVPKRLMIRPLVAAASSIFNCCIVSSLTKDTPRGTHVIIVPVCDDTEHLIVNFKGSKVKASVTTSRLHFTALGMSDGAESVD